MNYLITFTCYGTHLHGDPRGSVDKDHRMLGSPTVDSNPARQRFERKLMKDPPYQLNADARHTVLKAIEEVCTHRQWTLHAAHIRTTHVHAIVGSDEAPEKIMNTFKAYATRALNQTEPQHKRWARHGSTRNLWDNSALQQAIKYVVDHQGLPMATSAPAPQAPDTPSSTPPDTRQTIP